VKIFSQNSLFPIQIVNGFFIFYSVTWDFKNPALTALKILLEVMHALRAGFFSV
jgi:hypothetical protein